MKGTMATPLIPQVLIVDSGDRELEQLLQGCGLRTARGTAAELTGLAEPGVECPDLVVVDTRGGRPLPAPMAAVKRQHPAIVFLVVASDSDPAVLLEAMRAGATEFLHEPLTPAALDEAISRLVAHRESPGAKGEIFAIIGATGGVGTTTIAVNVAAALGKLSKGPASLLDLHLAYGDAAVFLGADARFSLLDAFENMHRMDAEFLRSLVVKTACGVELLPAGDRPVQRPVDVRQLGSILQLAASQYAYTVLDVPRSDLMVLDSLDQVANFVVVANQELATVRNAGRMATALRSRYPDAKVSTVINRKDGTAEIGPRDVEKAVGGTIVHQFPSDYRRALSAMHKGRPLALDNHNELSASFTALARELAGVKVQKAKKPSGGFMGLLSGRR